MDFFGTAGYDRSNLRSVRLCVNSEPEVIYPLSADQLLECMAIRRYRALGNSKTVTYLGHIDIPMRVNANVMWGAEIPRCTSIGADPAQQKVPIQIKNADVAW
jgi:hypothetical protein